MDLRRLALQELAYQAHGARNWPRLFDRIDRHRLLVQQAECFHGFAQCSTDLEQHALGGTVELGDWDHFVHYALLALNLRGAAEALDDDEILRALVRQERRELAENIAMQLSDPDRRAAARAVLGDCSQGAARSELVRQVRDDLRSIPRPEDARTAERTCAALLSVARHLGSEVASDWPELVTRIAPEPAPRNRLWLALAESCRPCGGDTPPICRDALREVDDPALLGATLRCWFSKSGSVQQARELIAALSGTDRELLWTLLFTVLSRHAATDAGLAWSEWREAHDADGPIPWSIAMIEASAGFLGALAGEQAALLAAELRDAAQQAAFHVVRLEATRSVQRAAAALESLRALPDSPLQLHWGLRALLAWPDHEAERRRSLTAALMEYLFERRYAAAAGDLTRYLDLVATVFPGELRRQLASVVYAPGGNAETLATLAAGAATDLLREALFERAEVFAVAVAASSAAAFELRAEILTRLAVTMCLAHHDLTALEQAVPRLLHDEEDRLRALVARDLATRHPALARQACSGIQAPRLQLVTRLALSPGGEGQAAASDADGLDPTSLYAAVATVEAVRDESLALSVLAEPPLDLRDLIQRWLRPMHGKERQVQALVDLAHHALAFEESFYSSSRRDPLGPLQIVRQALSGVGTDEQLLDLAIELVVLVAPLPLSRALPEIQETVDLVLLDLPAVDWPRRRDGIERLLLHIQPVLLRDLGRLTWRAAAARCRGAIHLLQVVAEMPERAAPGSARDDLRRHWHEVVPMLAAAGERWPLPARWRQRLNDFWASAAERFPANWAWLSERQCHLVRLALDTGARLREAADGWHGAPMAAPDEAAALALRLSHGSASLVADLVGSLPPGRFRDDLALRLVGNGWLAPPASYQVEALILDRATHVAARLARDDLEPAEWARLLGELVVRQGLDPAQPRSWPILRRLRTKACPAILTALAESTIQALTVGRRVGERALAIWLHAHLAPGDRPLAELRERGERVRVSIGRALSLTDETWQAEADARDGGASGRACFAAEAARCLRDTAPAPP